MAGVVGAAFGDAGAAGVVAAGLGAAGAVVAAGEGDVFVFDPVSWQAPNVTAKPSPTTKPKIFLFIHSSFSMVAAQCFIC